MNISSSYDLNRYSQYISQGISAQGQQVNTNKKMEDSATQQLLQISDNSTSDKKPVSPLKSLVDAGTITSDQEQAIKDVLEASRMAYQTQAGAANASSTFKNPLDSLVESGTITKDQETAVKSALESQMKAGRMQPPPPPPQQEDGTDSMTDVLGSLVSSGKITEDQKNSVVSALQTAFQSNQTQTDTTSDPLDSLVTAGTITKDQQTAIKSAFESKMKEAGGMPPPQSEQDENTDSISSILDNLVSKGTITEDQESSIISAFESAIKAYQTQSYSYEDSLPSTFNVGM